MGGARKPPRSRTQSSSYDRTVAEDAGSSPRIERLRKDFAKFRRTHPLRTRIPDSLRRAALSALQRGSSESEVRRACGVTSDQLSQWGKHQQVCAPHPSLETAAARVFPVVDSIAGLSPSSEPDQQGMELRIGTWAVYIKQLQG
jgi:hypothetical protein